MTLSARPKQVPSANQAKGNSENFKMASSMTLPARSKQVPSVNQAKLILKMMTKMWHDFTFKRAR